MIQFNNDKENNVYKLETTRKYVRHPQNDYDGREIQYHKFYRSLL